MDDDFDCFTPMPVPSNGSGWSGRSLPTGMAPTASRMHPAVQDTVEGLIAARRRDVTGISPTRTPGTLLHYRKTVASLVRQAGTPMDLETVDRLAWTIAWYSTEGGRWSPAVIRHHRACLLSAIEGLAASLDLDIAIVRHLLNVLETRPSPRSASASPRTSARKRMGISKEEFARLFNSLAGGKTETAQLLAFLVGYGVKLGLRPCEFRHAFVKGHQLVVRCAKQTNGRGLGRLRFLDLVGFDDQSVAVLRRFLVRFKCDARKASSWDAFFERLSKALTRACRDLQIPPIAPYTLRHQAIANAKIDFSRAEVAAFAGHLSQQSASRSYARRSGGWRIKPVCRPAPNSIACVKPLPRRDLTHDCPTMFSHP